MIGNGAEKNPIWTYTMMAKPEIPIKGMKKTTHMEQSQTELKDPVLSSGRLQSEISWKQKEGYSQHT